MADVKYMDLKAEDGAIRISFAVLAEISSEAALAVPGVAAMSSLPQATLKGVSVYMNEIGICSIDVHILAETGYVISQVAKTVQSAVKSAVDSAVGIEIASVNVFVSGIATK